MKIDPATGRFLKGVETLDDLLAMAAPEPTSGCWLWLGGLDKDGYGQHATRKRFPESRAHRLAWFLSHGPIPSGLLVMHKCDTPACINPRHLALGTTRDNVRDRVRKGRNGTPNVALHRANGLSEKNKAHLARVNARQRIVRDAKGRIARIVPVEPMS